MGFDQYHEPPAELSAETRTFAWMIASLTEEAEAIGWYQQRISLEPDPEARAIMANAQRRSSSTSGWTSSTSCDARRNGGSRCRRSSSPRATSSRAASAQKM